MTPAPHDWRVSSITSIARWRAMVYSSGAGRPRWGAGHQARWRNCRARRAV